MLASDVVELVGYLMGSFGVGFLSGALMRIFRRSAEKIR